MILFWNVEIFKNGRRKLIKSPKIHAVYPSVQISSLVNRCFLDCFIQYSTNSCSHHTSVHFNSTQLKTYDSSSIEITVEQTVAWLYRHISPHKIPRTHFHFLCVHSVFCYFDDIQIFPALNKLSITIDAKARVIWMHAHHGTHYECMRFHAWKCDSHENRLTNHFQKGRNRVHRVAFHYHLIKNYRNFILFPAIL